MVDVKILIRKRFNTRKINAWFRKNERKITKLILAGLITAPVLILLVKFLKDGTLSTVEKKNIVSVIEKIDNTPVNNRVLVKLEAPVARVLPPVVEKPIVVVPVTKITDSVSKSTTPLFAPYTVPVQTNPVVSSRKILEINSNRDANLLPLEPKAFKHTEIGSKGTFLPKTQIQSSVTTAKTIEDRVKEKEIKTSLGKNYRGNRPSLERLDTNLSNSIDSMDITPYRKYILQGYASMDIPQQTKVSIALFPKADSPEKKSPKKAESPVITSPDFGINEYNEDTIRNLQVKKSKSAAPLSLAVPLQDITPKPKGDVKTLASMRSIPSVIMPVKRTSKNTRNIMGIDSDNEVKKTQRMRPKTGSSPTASRRSSKTEKK